MTEKELYNQLEEYDKEVNRLFQENKELKELNYVCVGCKEQKYQQRINNAIEYINTYMPNYDFDHYNLAKLLKILKGE